MPAVPPLGGREHLVRRLCDPSTGRHHERDHLARGVAAYLCSRHVTDHVTDQTRELCSTLAYSSRVHDQVHTDCEKDSGHGGRMKLKINNKNTSDYSLVLLFVRGIDSYELKTSVLLLVLD